MSFTRNDRLTKVGRRDRCAVAQGVEEDRDSKDGVLRVEASGSPDFGGEAFHRRNGFQSSVQDRLFKVAQKVGRRYRRRRRRRK